MTYRLFIDDERDPVGDCVVARCSADAINYVKQNGFPTEINFDHDLGGSDTSIYFIYWLVEWMLDEDKKFPNGFYYTIHSQNPVGVVNIRSMMDNAIKVIGYEQNIH